MEMSTLEMFLVLAREGNMTRAASELHLTQPAVSARLARLEEALGYQLFDRTPRGMVLTEAGRLWRAHVEEAVDRLEAGQQALEALAGLERGELSIGGGATATTYLLPPLLGELHARHPHIRLFVREQGSQIVLESVLRGELDLGVVTLPVVAPSTTTAKLHIETWVEDELRLLVPEGHALAGRHSFEWGDLDGQPLVLFEAGSAVRELLDRRMARAQIRTEVVMELRSIESIKQMVVEGIGAAFVSRFALGDVDQQGLVCAEEPVRRELGLIWRTDRTMSPAAEAFLEMIT